MKRSVTRIISLFLCLSMILSIAVFTSAEEYKEPIVEKHSMGSDDTLLCTFMTDKNYTDIITDSDYDKYFKDMSAMEGVEAILNAGKYYINGFQVPATEEECVAADGTERFIIMGYDKLYKEGDVWKAENNKRTGTTFEDARMGMVEALSRTTGMPVFLYDTDDDGYTDMIYSSFYAVVVVEDIIDNGDGTISIDRGDFQLTKSNLDVNDVKFPKENVDENIKIGDMAMFWEDEDGWHLQREVSVKGKLTDARDHSYYVFNGETIKDGMHNPKAYIYFGNRPGQYSNAHLAFGLGDVEITYWITDRGSVISGFSSDDNARPSLEKVIEYCNNTRKFIAVSKDGSDVPDGQKWTTQEAWDAYDKAIKDASAILKDESSSNSVLDGAIYTLFQATWGEKAKYDYIAEDQTDKFEGFLGSIQQGKKAADDPYEIPDDEAKPREIPDLTAYKFPDVTRDTVIPTVLKTVNWAVDRGLIKGFSDGYFRPEESCTRLQFVTMIWRLSGRPSASADISFKDVDKSAATSKAVRWAVEKDIIRGFGDGTFRPDENVTRQQTAIMLWRMAGRQTAETEVNFSDVKTTDSMYKAVQWCSDKGLAKGFDDGTFGPAQNCLRQQIVIFLYRYAKYILGEKIEEHKDELVSTSIKAGAGIGTMIFPQEYFDITDENGNVIEKEDGFSGEVFTFTGNKGKIRDDLCTRVLLFEDGERAAIVSLEVAQAPADQVEYTKKIVSEVCGVKEENVWVHTTHQFGFMHRPSDPEKAAIYDEQCQKAVKEAAEMALKTFQPAIIGVGTGNSKVSANKNIINPKEPGVGPYYGPGSTLETDPALTMIRFQSIETGKDIGYYMSYGTKPSALCTTGKKVGNRKVNTEVTGEACKLVEEEYGVPCVFCMPAAGDQYPRETAMYYGFDKNGEWNLIDIGFDEGIKIVEKLGAELGADALAAAKNIKCDITSAPVSLGATSFDYPNKAEDGTINVTLDALTLGDIAFVGFKQEMDCVTGQQIQAASPYKTTLMVSFLNGDGKYIGHKEAYEFNQGAGTWETKRSAFAIGAAEKMVDVAAELLKNVKNGSSSKDGPDSGEKTGFFSTIDFAGETWYVLEYDKINNKKLIMSKSIRETRAFHNDNTAARTWETSDIRAYLNNEYLNTFSEADRAKILTTDVVNKSNPTYGISGGNNTKDKIFLLSLDEAELYLQGFSEVLIGKTKDNKPMWWFLRTPGEAVNVSACVNTSGAIDSHGVSDTLEAPKGGIRPCMWIAAN